MAEEEQGANPDEIVPVEEAQRQEEPYVDEKNYNVQGLYNLKGSELIPTEKNKSPLNAGGRHSSNVPKYVIEGAEAKIAEHYGEPVPPPKVKKYQRNGQKIEYEEEKVMPELSPADKAKVAFEMELKKYQEEQAAKATAAAGPGQAGLGQKAQRVVSQAAETQRKYTEQLLRAKELENQFKSEKTKLELEKIKADAERQKLREEQDKRRFEREEKEKEYNFTKGQHEYLKKLAEEQAGRPLTEAEFKTKLITAQQGLRVKEAEEKKYQFRQTPTGKLVTGVERVGTGLGEAARGISAGIIQAAKQYGPANIAELRGQIIPQEASPQPQKQTVPVQVQQGQVAPTAVSPYRQAAYDVGGGTLAESTSSDYVLAQVGGQKLPGSNPEALTALGGRIQERG